MQLKAEEDMDGGHYWAFIVHSHFEIVVGMAEDIFL